MTPTLDTAEAYNDEIQTKAVNYVASLFLGQGQYDREEADTREGLDEAAAILKARNPNVHSQPILTAINANGDSSVIGQPYVTQAERKAKAAKKAKEAKAAAKAAKTAAITEAAETAKAEIKETMAELAALDAKPAERSIDADIAEAITTAKAKTKATKTAKVRAELALAKKAKSEPVRGITKKAKAAAPEATTEPKVAGERKSPFNLAKTAAARGELPAAPDFSAPSYTKPYTSRLAALVALVDAADVAGLEAYTIKPYDSAMIALDRYRNLAVTAFKAKAAAN